MRASPSALPRLAVILAALLAPSPGNALPADAAPRGEGQPPALAAIDPSLLAPGPVEWAAQVLELRKRLDEADAVGIAEARIQNRLAIGPMTREALCATEESRSLLARSLVFGAGYRDAVQAARAHGERLRRMLAEPTLQPLLWQEQRQNAEILLQRVEAHVVRYREMSSWQVRHLAAAARSCPTPLSSAKGLDGEAAKRVAVVGVGGGSICPQGAAADGRVIVLAEPLACHATHGCDCKPLPVAPGAVIGP